MSKYRVPPLRGPSHEEVVWDLVRILPIFHTNCFQVDVSKDLKSFFAQVDQKPPLLHQILLLSLIP